MQIRQGDILLLLTNGRNQMDGDAAIVSSGVIATGEATGHAHRVVDGEVRVDRSNMYVVSNGGAQLVHDEHETIAIPEGTYRVLRQREEGDEGRTHYVAD